MLQGKEAVVDEEDIVRVVGSWRTGTNGRFAVRLLDSFEVQRDGVLLDVVTLLFEPSVPSTAGCPKYSAFRTGSRARPRHLEKLDLVANSRPPLSGQRSVVGSPVESQNSAVAAAAPGNAMPVTWLATFRVGPPTSLERLVAIPRTRSADKRRP